MPELDFPVGESPTGKSLHRVVKKADTHKFTHLFKLNLGRVLPSLESPDGFSYSMLKSMQGLISSTHRGVLTCA